METAGPTLRWLRAGALAGVATLVGVVAHVSAGGLLPSGLVLLLTGLVMAAAFSPLLAREASALRLVLLTVGGQTAIHTLLTITAGHAGDPARSAGAHTGPAPQLAPLPVDAGGRRVGSLADYAQVQPVGGGGLTIPDPVRMLLGELTGPQAPMMLAHLLASVLVGLWLARGERALWRVLRMVWRAVAVPVLRAPLVVRRTTVLARRTPRRVHRLDLDDVVARRGPPLLLA